MKKVYNYHKDHRKNDEQEARIICLQVSVILSNMDKIHLSKNWQCDQ